MNFFVRRSPHMFVHERSHEKIHYKCPFFRCLSFHLYCVRPKRFQCVSYYYLTAHSENQPFWYYMYIRRNFWVEEIFCSSFIMQFFKFISTTVKNLIYDRAIWQQFLNCDTFDRFILIEDHRNLKTVKVTNDLYLL